MSGLATCLWFDHQAAEAAAFYVSVFPNSRVVRTTHYPEGTQRPAGSVLMVQFVADGSEYVALNGGPLFKHSPAMSLIAYCDTQEDVDRLWRELTAGGQESQCGWLVDKYGVSWQVVPRPLLELLNSSDAAASQRVFQAIMPMKKLDIAALQRAFKGA